MISNDTDGLGVFQAKIQSGSSWLIPSVGSRDEAIPLPFLASNSYWISRHMVHITLASRLSIASQTLVSPPPLSSVDPYNLREHPHLKIASTELTTSGSFCYIRQHTHRLPQERTSSSIGSHCYDYQGWSSFSPGKDWS